MLCATLLLSVDGLVLPTTPTKHRAATALRASSSSSTWQTLRDLRQRALETVIGPEPDLPDAGCDSGHGCRRSPAPSARAAQEMGRSWVGHEESR